MRNQISRYALVLLISPAITCFAADKHISIDDGECSEHTPAKTTVIKTDVFNDSARSIRAYDELSFQRKPGKASDRGCHVTYTLFVAVDGKSFASVHRESTESDKDETDGIELIGLSPDGSKFATDFFWAAGDATLHRPMVFDLSSNESAYLPLDDRIQKLIHGCDQVEDFVGVTNAGEAVFAIPPSIYDNSPGCGDKGLWHFNLKTGRVYRVARISGDKWR